MVASQRTGNAENVPITLTSQWPRCVSNHQPRGCLLNCLFRRRPKKTSKFRITGLCAGNSPGPMNSPRHLVTLSCDVMAPSCKARHIALPMCLLLCSAVHHLHCFMSMISIYNVCSAIQRIPEMGGIGGYLSVIIELYIRDRNDKIIEQTLLGDPIHLDAQVGNGQYTIGISAKWAPWQTPFSKIFVKAGLGHPTHPSGCQVCKGQYKYNIYIFI